MKLKKPEENYKPTMTFKTKCLYCGQKFKVLGYYAFEQELEKHRKTCKETKK